MYDVVHKQRISRLDRSLTEESSRTFQLRRFEGIPHYTGVLQPVGSCLQRDEDDTTVTRRRSTPPPQRCRYSLMCLVVAVTVFVVICVQFTYDMPILRPFPRLTSRMLQETERNADVSGDRRGLPGEACPVCPVCAKNST